MYKGIESEHGNRIYDRDAFGYACDRILIGDSNEQKTFMDIARDSEDMRDFAKQLIEWYYSGNWLYDPCDQNTEYIIRFEDNSLNSYYGNYFEAVEYAKKLSQKNGMSFVVN